MNWRSLKLQHDCNNDAELGYYMQHVTSIMHFDMRESFGNFLLGQNITFIRIFERGKALQLLRAPA